MKKNMTTGNPLRLLIAFSIPLILGNLVQQFYSMADAIIVGRTISLNALAAIGTTGPYCFLILGFFWGLGSGLATVTGQYFGANNLIKVKQSFATSIIIIGTSSIVSTLFCLFITNFLLHKLNVPENLFHDSSGYLFVMFLGLSGISCYNFMAAVLRALGDSRTPLFFLIIASILNIGLDFLFILTFGWGVVSVAWATVISQLLSGVWCYFYAMKKFHFLHLHKSDWIFDWHFSWEHLRIALPMAVQTSAVAIGVIILQAEVNKLGELAIGAYTIATRVEQLTVQPLCSFAMALGVFAAQNYGAKRYNRIRVAMTQMSIFSMIASTAIGFVIYLFIPQFIKLFVGADALVSSPDLLRYVRTFMLVALPFYFTLQMLQNFRQTLQGMSLPTIPFISCVMELITRGLFAVTLSKYGFLGISFVSPVGWLLAAIVLGIWYYKKIFHYTKRYF